MPLNYDEGKNLAILSIDTDSEALLNAITILIEKGIIPKNNENGFEVSINAKLNLDTVNEKLLVTF